MSSPTDTIFRPISQPGEGCCCICNWGLSDQDEIIYNIRKARFEAVPKNGWFDCFRPPIQIPKGSQNQSAWFNLGIAVNNVVGERLGEFAFTLTNFAKQKETHSPLTVRAYNRITAKAIELQSLENSAYKVWKAGKFYQAFLMKTLKERNSKSTKVEPLQGREMRIVINLTGLQGKGRFYLFELEEIAASIQKLSCKKPIGQYDAKAIAHSIYSDLVTQRITNISLDNLIRQIVSYVKKKGYKLLKPEHWKTVQPLVKLPFEQLTFEQLNKLVEPAKEFPQKTAPRERREGEERKSDQKSSINPKGDVFQTCTSSSPTEKSPLLAVKEKGPSKLWGNSSVADLSLLSPIDSSSDSSNSSD